jgi:hypothetical protein
MTNRRTEQAVPIRSDKPVVDDIYKLWPKQIAAFIQEVKLDPALDCKVTWSNVDLLQLCSAMLL